MLVQCKVIESYIQGIYDGYNQASDNNTNNTPQDIITSNKSNQLLLNSSKDMEKEFNLKYNDKTIFKRTDRKKGWYMRFYHNGVQHKICGLTQKEVIDKYKKLKKNGFNKKIITPSIKTEITLKQWFNKYLKLYKIGKVTDTTIKIDQESFKKFSKLHNLELRSIDQFMLQEALNKIEHKSVQNRSFILINALFEKAYRNGLVEKNMMKLVDKPKYKAKQKLALTKDQEQQFVESCKKHKFGDYFLICLYQGLRRGECRALKVNDVDFKNMTLRIDESLNNHTTRTNTKNEQSNRVMPIFDKSVQILKNNISNKTEDDLIFNIGVNRVEKALKEILSNTNLPKITTHILRHTFITRCQEANIPLFVVQSWVGHEKGSVVTTRIYTHLNAETDKKYTDLMNKMSV